MIVLDKQKQEPFSFDQPAYSGCYEWPLNAMDKRHVFMVYGVLTAWPFKSALEIGSFHGASSTAFIEAINSGRGLGESGSAMFCDVSVTDQLISVVRNCKDLARVNITPQPSWAVLDSEIDFDFVLVDGAHDEDTVGLEMKRLLKRRPLCVMAHDTTATVAGFSKCEGAQMLRRTFIGEMDYWCIEDAAYRDGERTERGLFLACRDYQLLEKAKAVFAKYE